MSGVRLVTVSGLLWVVMILTVLFGVWTRLGRKSGARMNQHHLHEIMECFIQYPYRVNKIVLDTTLKDVVDLEGKMTAENDEYNDDDANAMRPELQWSRLALSSVEDNSFTIFEEAGLFGFA